MKSLIPFIAAIVIAGGSFFTGAVTDIGEAAKIAFDKEAAKEHCEQLIDGNFSE